MKRTKTVEETEMAFHIQHIYLDPASDLNILEVY